MPADIIISLFIIMLAIAATGAWLLPPDVPYFKEGIILFTLTAMIVGAISVLLYQNSDPLLHPMWRFIAVLCGLLADFVVASLVAFVVRRQLSTRTPERSEGS
jgi:hypothetical protein